VRELAGHTVREAPIDAADLPEYAGRLYDRFAADPVMARLAGWYRLEGSGYAAVDLVVASTRDKLAAVAKAQEEGLIPDRFTPVEVLALVVHLSSLWFAVTPEMGSLTDDIPHERRREVVVAAARALLRD
jgi:hypothetical protein